MWVSVLVGVGGLSCAWWASDDAYLATVLTFLAFAVAGLAGRAVVLDGVRSTVGMWVDVILGGGYTGATW